MEYLRRSARVSRLQKNQLGKTIVESVACYGCEVWPLKTEEERKLLALEMEYLRRSTRVSRLQKNQLGKTIVESVARYGCEVWPLKTEEQRKLLALEIDYLRSARVSRLQKIPNTIIKSKMQAEQSILDRIKRRQLKWYGHLL